MSEGAGPTWSTGLCGCLEIKTDSPVDPWNYTLSGAVCCPCCMYAVIRKIQLEAAPGEHLYCVENTCGSNVWLHALVQTLWCLSCPPVNGGINRGIIRRQAKIPGGLAQDVLMHSICCPLALAQEARHLKMKGYTGETILRLPAWRSCLVGVFPLHDLNQRLLTAANDGDVGEAEQVLKLGADANVKGINDSTPLMFAAHEGHADVLKLLIEFGARVDQEDRSGTTAMHRAAQMGHTDIVTSLYLKGANAEKTDTWGKRPEDYATGKTYDIIRAMLGKKHIPKALHMSSAHVA